MQDLHTLPGDVASVGLAVNSSSQAVGLSLDSGGNPRAFLWQNGVITDLNALIPSDSPFLVLFVADVINSSGEIAGFGLTSSFDVHGFLATPSKGTAAAESIAVATQSETSESAKTALRENVRNDSSRAAAPRAIRNAAARAAVTNPKIPGSCRNPKILGKLGTEPSSII